MLVKGAPGPFNMMHLIVRSCEVSNIRDRCFGFWNDCEILQASWQHY